MQGWRQWLLVVAASTAVLSQQVVLEQPTALEHPLGALSGPNVTGNLIFQSVSSLLQHWPNTKYVNGHTIISASIAPGTLLYHGRSSSALALDKPEWLATDPEHSYIFCRGTCQLLSFVTTRKLRLAYFDGSSASNMVSGTLDSQDIMIWGKVREDKVWGEWERVEEACKWGKPYGLDGFVRMEMDFEVMACNFVDGLQLVSNSTILAATGDALRPFETHHETTLVDEPYPPPHPPPGAPGGERGPGGPPRGPGGHPHGPDRRPRFPTPVIPDGWKGSLRSGSSVSFEVMHSGSWHNHIPGETRVRVDYSRLVSFFDPALTSLVAARASQNRSEYRISGISPEDTNDVRDQLVDIFTRDGEGSGIDWGSIVHVVIERYSERLQLVQHLLEPSESRNITEQAAQIRAQVLIMLTPYMLTAAIPSNTTTNDRSWIAPVTNHCASTLTSWAPVDTLTRQEKVIKNAIDEVLQQICRVLGDVWIDAFGVEDATVEETQSFLNKWSKDINGLMAWLDWSVWDTCRPACGPEEICYIPTWPWVGGWRGRTEKVDMTPRCVSRLEPYDFQTW